MEWFLLSYNSVGYLTSATLAVWTTIYLLVQKNKSRQTWLLTGVFTGYSLLFIGYLFWFTVYGPNSAYALYLVNAVVIGFCFLIQFAYYFPRNLHPRESKVLLVISILGSAAAYGQLTLLMQPPLSYDFRFDVHAFYPRVADADQSLGAVFALSPLWALIVFLRKTIIFSEYSGFWSKWLDKPNSYAPLKVIPFLIARFVVGILKIAWPMGKDARAVRGIALVIFSIIAIAVCFVLYGAGLIQYDTYTYISTTATAVALFFLVMFHINNSPEPSTFMFKLIGISLVTLLVVIGTIAKVTLGIIEVSYDENRRAEVEHVKELAITNDYSHVPLSVEYIVSMPMQEQPAAEDIKTLFARNKTFTKEALFTALTKIGPIKVPAAIPERSYLEAPNDLHYIHYDFNQGGLMYQVGFSYKGYRQKIHSIAQILVYIILGSTVIILVMFPRFFRDSLTHPLMSLMDGVKTVNEGDLSSTVPIKVEDEIGFLSRSFNGMVQSIREARQQLQDYADHLEEKVKERTADLQRSLEQVQALKTQQDGDYFLTSLLIKPLASNHAKSETTSVDFVVKQKKQFQFRKWQEEIGGDICTANTIHLQGNPYTVFLNADAMGKSIQGASGALVLGAVFESIIERTKLVSSAHDIYPERWLKNNFVELQKVFESFDGSMLMSMVLGLVDDKTGLMYFINAEHPWTILYREQKAAFIENELEVRKLGTVSNSNENLRIRIFQLEPGDVIIAGSDGRDDILMGIENGHRIINEDETVFLKRVEEGDGLLDKIIVTLENQGELTDDTSLLRVSYMEDYPVMDDHVLGPELISLLSGTQNARQQGDYKEAHSLIEKAYNIDNAEPAVLKEMVQVFALLKDYEQASKYARIYIDLRPSDTNFMYVTSFCLKKAGYLDKAADIGERVRLREPNMVKNLVNLSHVYMLMNHYSRADLLAGDALKQDASNKNAQNIKNAMSNRLNKTSEVKT